MTTIIRWAADARQAHAQQKEWIELDAIAKSVQSESVQHLDIVHSDSDYIVLPSTVTINTYEQLLDELSDRSYHKLYQRSR